MSFLIDMLSIKSNWIWTIKEKQPKKKKEKKPKRNRYRGSLRYDVALLNQLTHFMYIFFKRSTRMSKSSVFTLHATRLMCSRVKGFFSLLKTPIGKSTNIYLMVLLLLLKPICFRNHYYSYYCWHKYHHYYILLFLSYVASCFYCNDWLLLETPSIHPPHSETVLNRNLYLPTSEYPCLVL